MYILALSVAFLVIAAIYSSIGFGGGSSYTAILLVSGVPVLAVPIISLSCNLMVTTAGAAKVWRAGLLRLKSHWPLFCFSVPAAFLGGLTPVSEDILILVLATALLASGIQMLWSSVSGASEEYEVSQSGRLNVSLIIGGSVGYVSGLVGIGGGIFLSPLLHHLKWETPRRISAISTGFIAINSLAALIGKSISFAESNVSVDRVLDYWPLLLAVFLGSIFGHKLMTHVFSEVIIKRITAILIILVALRILMLRVL